MFICFRPCLQPKVVPEFEKHLLVLNYPIIIDVIQGIVIYNKENISHWRENPMDPDIDANIFALSIVLYIAV